MTPSTDKRGELDGFGIILLVLFLLFFAGMGIGFTAAVVLK